MHKLLRVLIPYFLFLTLSACGPNKSLEINLPGVWEGQNEKDGFRWCITLTDDSELSIRTLQRSHYDTEANWEVRGRSTHYNGTWLFTDGNRLMLYPDFENMKIENRSEGAEALVNFVIPHYYIISHADQQRLRKTSHPRGEKGSWIESTRNSDCSNDFKFTN